MPTIYISKYNRFVDNIIGRINHILGKSYDPVRVKLQTVDTKKNKSKKKRNKKRRKSSRISNKMAEIPIGRSNDDSSYILVAKTGIDEIKNTPTMENRAKSAKKQNKRKNNKTKQVKKTTKARATLYGLSTIKRDGDVIVNVLQDHTTVKSNFILGPLTLRVEREFVKGDKRELKSATATTTDMFGRLNLRIVHGGAATLHSIRVLQPKQVRVESADNHEKTREFLWRRSSHIASVVSQKLTSAAKSMLKPPPVA